MPSKPLSAYTESSSIHNRLPTLHKHMAPHRRIPNTPTYIHPYTPTYTNTNIPTVAAFFRPPPYQTQPTNLGSTENTMEYQGYGDQGITQRLQDTPKHSLLC